MKDFVPHDYLSPGKPDRRIRNKDYAADSSYHVYNRGLNEQPIFLDDIDRRAFLAFLARLLAPEETRDPRGRPVISMRGEAAVLAYALMNNHYHLVIHQFESDQAVRRLIGRAMSAYVMYFNRRHNRRGALCHTRFSAVKIESPRQLRAVIAYVHVNPNAPFSDPWTSHALYMSNAQARQSPWCSANLGLRAFGSRGNYLEELHAKLRSSD